jgi:L-rhamnose mutarotase
MKEALEIITKPRRDKHSHTMARHDIFVRWQKDWENVRRKNRKESKRMVSLKENTDKRG